MDTVPTKSSRDPPLEAGGGGGRGRRRRSSRRRGDRCSRIRGKKACWAAGCVRSHHRCVKPRFAPGQIVKVKSDGEYCVVVRALPNNRYLLRSLQHSPRHHFRVQGSRLDVGAVAHHRNMLVMPSGRMVPRAKLRQLFRLSSDEVVYIYDGEPVLLRHGTVDRHASRTTILDLLERLAAHLSRERTVAHGRPRCDPFYWRSDQICRNQGYPGGCGSNKYPTHCNPGGESGGSAALRAVRRYRQRQPQSRQHQPQFWQPQPRQPQPQPRQPQRASSSSSCKAGCHAWPENTKEQRRAKHACFVSCKER